MRELNCDIAVVAAGPAGLAAAITAAEEGRQVIVFEKNHITGGTANMGIGPFAVESDLQKDLLDSLTVEEGFQEYMRETRWHVDARLVRNYFEKSADTIRWLQDMGVQFAGVKKYFPGSHCTWHLVQPEGGGKPGPRSAGTMCRKMTEHALKLGVTFLMDTPVIQICSDKTYVDGVIARGPDGSEIHCHSRAVIVATGGFGCNDEMIREYTGYTYGKDMFNFHIPGIEGDGLKMAWEARAGRGRISMEKIIHLVAGSKDERLLPLSNLFQQPNLVVNLEGRRIMNEGQYCF